MEGMHTKVSDFEFIQASLNTQPERENSFASHDPFSKSWDDLKSLSGIDNNFKRRAARNLNKNVATEPSTLKNILSFSDCAPIG